MLIFSLSLREWWGPVIVNYQDFPIFSSNFKILEILKFFHQFIKENHQFIKFIKFHKIFFFGPRPSIQKITNANTNTNKDRKDDSHIFHREMITNLTPGWQLVDTLLTIVQVQQLDILTFFQCQRFFMQCEFLQVQWPNTF